MIGAMRGETKVPVQLSVVIPTTEGWPEIADKLATVRAAVARVDAELLVVDGSGHPPPDASEWPFERWISSPGETVYQLRLLGYRSATGRVVAVTEDHCIVPIDWAERVLKAHVEWPDAAVVVGAVTNGTADRGIDRANFFANLLAFLPPLRSGKYDGSICHVNISYKREALRDIEDYGGLGTVDFLHVDKLRRAGRVAYLDGRVHVAHIQASGPMKTASLHFHAGRSMAAFQQRQMDLVQWLRVAGVLVIPILRLAKLGRTARSTPYGGQVAASAPWILMLFYAQAFGKLTGHLAGPGDSPSKLV
jgi:hypothetical protein